MPCSQLKYVRNPLHLTVRQRLPPLHGRRVQGRQLQGYPALQRANFGPTRSPRGSATGPACQRRSFGHTAARGVSPRTAGGRLRDGRGPVAAHAARAGHELTAHPAVNNFGILDRSGGSPPTAGRATSLMAVYEGRHGAHHQAASAHAYRSHALPCLARSSAVERPRTRLRTSPSPRCPSGHALPRGR